MIKTNEILRQYYFNLFSSSAEITKSGNNNYIYKWNVRDLKLNNAEMALIQIANNKATLTEERQYPPKLYNSFTNETSLIYLDQNPVYYETITLNTDNINYGSGTYEIYSSSSILTLNRQKKQLFNYILNEENDSAHFNITYNNLGYFPNTTQYINNGYFGDWIIITLPSPIILTRFRFYNRPTQVLRAPSLWKCYGSNDGINYTEIIEGSNNINPITSTMYSQGYYEQIVNQAKQQAYLYLGFTINKITGTDTILNFAELQLFGRETIKSITDIRQYPSKLYNSFTTEVLNTGEIFNINPTTYYKETITLTASGLNYGYGDYIIYSSGTANDVFRTKARLFNRTIISTPTDIGPFWGYNNYFQSTGVFAFDRYIKSDYLGEWSIIKFPSPIILSKYIIYLRNDQIIRGPSLLKFYGSNDGNNFIEITEASITTALSAADYVSNKYEKTLNTTFNTPYLYIGFCINKIIGLTGATGYLPLSMTELELFGKEEQNNKFVIRALNCYNDGYDSQNQSGCILYEGSDLQTIKNPTYHKLISKNLNSISLLLNDNIEDKPNNGISDKIDLGLVL
jgi:hypothetical protein